MALSLIEINRMQLGIVRPAEITLFELTVLMTKKHAQYMLNVEKDTSGNPEAASYKSKIDTLAKRAINNDSGLFQNLLSNICINAGNTLEYSAVKAYTDAEWELLVSNNMPTAFDLLADTTPSERDAWAQLPFG